MFERDLHFKAYKKKFTEKQIHITREIVQQVSY